jgi:oxalate decarboxylase
VENIGDSEAKLMLVHNHAEFTTVNLSEWVAGGPASVFASTLKIPVQAFDNAPTKKVFIRTKDGKA